VERRIAKGRRNFRGKIRKAIITAWELTKNERRHFEAVSPHLDTLLQVSTPMIDTATGNSRVYPRYATHSIILPLNTQ
jgi:hypothetical protein